MLADESGAIVVDPRVELILPPQRRPDFAVRPYPRGLEETVRLHDGRDILIRPLRATDQEAWLRMLERVSAEDMRMRFFASFRAPSPALVARLTQIDYAREMALVAVEPARSNCSAWRGFMATPTIARANTGCWCAPTGRATGSARR